MVEGMCVSFHLADPGLIPGFVSFPFKVVPQLDKFWEIVGKPEGKHPVGRPRMRWENNINHNLREVDY